MPLSGCLIAKRLSSSANRSRSSARSMLSGDVPMIGTPARSKRHRQLERRLAAELHDHAVGLFPLDDVHHVFHGQRLEIELVRSIVIGAHGFGVAVDHDGLKAFFLEGEGRVHAAIIELDALADTVRPAAEDHDFLARRCAWTRPHLRTWNISTACTPRTRRRRCRRLEYRIDTLLFARLAHCRFRAPVRLRDPRVGEAHLLPAAQGRRIQLVELAAPVLNFPVGGNDLAYLFEKPWVDRRTA